MFLLHEKVVYPGHGVAEVNRIVEKSVCGCCTMFYEFVIISTQVLISVPCTMIADMGIRPISSSEYVYEMLKMLEKPSLKRIENGQQVNWSKKNKVYQCALRSGDIDAVVKIYQELVSVSSMKDLSFGERSLLNKTENLLVEEIAMATNITVDCARMKLRAAMGNTI